LIGVTGGAVARCALLAILLWSAGAGVAGAQEALPDRPAMSLAWSAGAIDVIDAVTRGFFSVELRQRGGRWPPSPWLGFEATGHDRFYGFGALIDLPLGRGWVFTPSLGAALFRDHAGLHLGFPVEFRSMAEFSCGEGGRRVGIAVGHYSNLNIGVTNRGTEFLRAVLIVPLGHAARGPRAEDAR
jgi:hypothetical protein